MGVAVKVLHSICQYIWKTQQLPQDWKGSVFITIPKKGNAKAYSNYYTIAHISHASKVMLKILQVRHLSHTFSAAWNGPIHRDPLPKAPLQGQPVSLHYCALRRLIGCRISAQVRDKVAVLGKEGEKLT